MPLFPYLPAIIWLGLIQLTLDATHGRREQDAQRDPADSVMDATIIRFPSAHGCLVG